MPFILYRYLLKKFFTTLITIILTFIFLVFFADIMDNLDDFISYNLPFSQYINYYLYTAPTVFIVCLPFAVLLSSMRLFRNMSSSNEYIALIMSGISFKKIIMPIFISSLLLSLTSFYVTDKVAPNAQFQRKVMQKDKFKVNVSIIKNINLAGRFGETYYINEYIKDEKKIKGLMVTYARPNNQIEKRVLAEEVFWENEMWKGKKIKIINYKEDGTPLIPEYKESMFFLKFFHPSEIILSKSSPNFLSVTSLKRLIKYMPSEQVKAKNGLLIDYYRKFSISFLPAIILFIAIPFSIVPDRTASSKTIGIGILISFAYYVVEAFFYQAGQGMLIHPIAAAWSANIIFIVMAGLLIRKVPK